ncbi:hypothetical protein RchiOBHm_Chr5g0006661 [Rosa chinensis]|uniref:Uncharacterized protein n=1 Tax=Rosa chinensis TaxID=74649 RepID=A0A2P6Q3M8_ROSCH|nr:hypothetical protein RchiOBHm_Chr5g0006661 [Rosa chinensis]
MVESFFLTNDHFFEAEEEEISGWFGFIQLLWELGTFLWVITLMGSFYLGLLGHMNNAELKYLEHFCCR